jgi:hypothetical protein
MKNRRTVIVATTDAVSTKQSFETQGYPSVIICADNLDGSEEVDLFMLVGDEWKTVVDETGTAKKLTASITMLVLIGGPVYAATKDATAGATGVYFYRQTSK